MRIAARSAFYSAGWSRIALPGFCLLVLLLHGGAVSWLEAQSSGQSAQTSEEMGPDGQRILVEVQEVQIPFTVFDKKGNLVLDLQELISARPPTCLFALDCCWIPAPAPGPA